MDLNIKKCHNEHLTRALEITKSCARAMISNGIYQWNESYPSWEKLKTDIENNELYGIFNKQLLLGIVVITEIEDPEYKTVDWLTDSNKSVYIHRLAVDPIYQGRGLAQKLMDFAETRARENGFSSVRLDTFSQNPRNNKFYQKRNYQKLGDIYFPNQSSHAFHCYELVF